MLLPKCGVYYSKKLRLIKAQETQKSFCRIDTRSVIDTMKDKSYSNPNIFTEIWIL